VYHHHRYCEESFAQQRPSAGELPSSAQRDSDPGMPKAQPPLSQPSQGESWDPSSSTAELQSQVSTLDSEGGTALERIGKEGNMPML